MSRPIPSAPAARVPQIAGQSSRRFPSSPPASLDALKLLLGALAAASLCVSCAVQGPPLPPRVERPEQIKDLAVIQKGRAFILSFTLPALATDGERLTKPMDVEIFEMVTPRGATPASLPGTASPAAVLKPADVRRFKVGKKLVYPMALSAKDYSNSLGQTYSFAARGVTYGFRHRALDAKLSNPAQATLLDVSGPVENLRIRTTEMALELDWSPPAQTLSGGKPSALSGYRVYRSESGKPGFFELETVTKSPGYSDADFIFDHNYFYKVQAQFTGDHSTAESAESPPVEITPRDTFPPAAPRDVEAIYAAGAVEITWTPSPAPDLAGYNVLRSEKSGEETRINQQLVRTPVFRDARVVEGRRYIYRVTAVDFSGNESAPSAPAEVETR